MTDYSLVVVARDPARALLAVLLHIRQYAAPSEVLLVNNGSSTNLASATGLARVRVREIRLSEHQSLGTALNAGIDAADNDLILLLHGDVLLQTDPGPTVRWLEQHPEVGVVGGMLLADEPAPRRVLHAGYRLLRGRSAPKPITRWEGDLTADTFEQVPAVNDACMLLRRTDIRFDERYWFKLEDVDVCHQYRQSGYEIASASDLRAVDPARGGAQEYAGGLEWMARGVASHLLYHARWCTDLPLDEHPQQSSVRGEAAVDYLRDVDRSLVRGGPHLVVQG